MKELIHGSLLEAALGPWAGREDRYDEPRYQLARHDEPSMRNLIRAELLPGIMRWDTQTLERLRIALALALTFDVSRMESILESMYAPVAFPEYGSRYFWLWVWDELFHEDLPDASALEGYELDWTPGRLPAITVLPDCDAGEWLQIFEARKQVRYRLEN